MNRLFISAAHKSSGKTTVSVGLCAALRARGEVVQPFKKGPDYIDPLWLGLAAGRSCYNLDAYLSSPDEIRAEVAYRMRGASLGLVEGNKGLYDGLDLDGSNSNAALAVLLETPVVLVLDARGMTRGIAPLILGYRDFDRRVRIAGIILNQLGGSRHESKLRAVIDHYTGVPVLGAIQHDERLTIVERHLGLVPSNEARAEAARAQVDAIAGVVASQVDMDRLVELARSAPPPAALANGPAGRIDPRRNGPRVRVGVARDAAFGFYYPGDLEALREAGAELVAFDALRDRRLPQIDGLFIGGGFPEMHMERLSRNEDLRSALHTAIESGLPTYAECGGLMYLARGIEWNGRRARMVGVVPADIVMHPKPVGRGYVHLRETGRSPWSRVSAPAAERVRAHEFHYSSIENLSPAVEFAYEVERGHGVDGRHDGIVHKNMLASYSHLRDVADNRWARRFVAFVQSCRLDATADASNCSWRGDRCG